MTEPAASPFAIEIDGEAYWDGGYLGNPSLLPLIAESPAHDLVLVQAGSVPRFFDASQLPACKAPVLVLTDWFKRLMQSARTAEHPFNGGLMLEALTADAQQTLRAQG